jgi:Predicted hydrolases of HD superfamily
MNLDADLLCCFFDAANMHRWNDHLRPIELTELDKQSHKVAIAWMLGKFEESNGRKIKWKNIIEYSMFSFIQRLILTDLKPSLFHRIKSERSKELNDYVIHEFERLVPNCCKELKARFVKYLRGDRNTKEDRIIRAAHYLATYWEFRLIKDLNSSLYAIRETEKDIENELDIHKDLHGVSEIMLSRSFGLVDLFGQLRFQQRWARTPRVPKTTVLGHMLLVANMVYLNDLDKGTSDDKAYKNYFKALFHDLPEVLTKDVISPVKNNVGGLNELLEDYERELVESKIIPLIPKDWHNEFRELIYDPFSGDGYDIKTCDLLAAYMEADMSIRYGIGSAKLKRSRDEIKRTLLSRDGIDTERLIKRLNEIDV